MAAATPEVVRAKAREEVGAVAVARAAVAGVVERAAATEKAMAVVGLVVSATY